MPLTIVEYRPKIQPRIEGTVNATSVVTDVQLGADAIMVQEKGQIPIALGSTINTLLGRQSGDIAFLSVSDVFTLLGLARETHISLVALATEHAFS